MAFSEQLKSLLQKRSMKAVDLSRKTGLSEAAISDYLKGKKEPRAKQSIAVANALDVSLDELFETRFAKRKESAILQNGGLSERAKAFGIIYDELTEDIQNKLDELARLYLDDQRRKGGTL